MGGSASVNNRLQPTVAADPTSNNGRQRQPQGPAQEAKLEQQRAMLAAAAEMSRKEHESSEESDEGGPLGTEVKVFFTPSSEGGPAVPQLTEKQRKIILTSWTDIRQRLSSVGAMEYKSIFETHSNNPGGHRTMPFDELPPSEVECLSTLRAHSLRAMSIVEKLCTRIHNQKQTDQILDDLGKQHINQRIVKPGLMCFVADQFIYSIRQMMEMAGPETRWTGQVEAAWRAFLYGVVWRLHRGMKHDLAARELDVRQADQTLTRLLIPVAPTYTNTTSVPNGGVNE